VKSYASGFRLVANCLVSSTIGLAAATVPAPRMFVLLGMQSTSVHSLVADSAGNYYVAGTSKNHVLVAKLDPNGRIVYTKSGFTAFGGPQELSRLTPARQAKACPTKRSYSLGMCSGVVITSLKWTGSRRMSGRLRPASRAR